MLNLMDGSIHSLFCHKLKNCQEKWPENVLHFLGIHLVID
jgi:hypothetical protein